MKNGIITILVFIATEIEMLAQGAPINNRWTFKSSYSSFALNSGYYSSQVRFMDAQGTLKSKTSGQFLVEANYGVNNNIEMAIYTGVARLPVYSDDPLETQSVTGEMTLAFFYGIATNFHMLPLFLTESTLPIDFYVGNRFGLSHYSTQPGRNPKSGSYPDFGVYSGLAYYPVTRIGIFGEYGISNGISWNANGVPRSFRAWFKAGVCVKMKS